MKLITRDTDYAIRALCYIAKHKDRIVSVNELVAKLKIPRPFLRKILQILNKEDLLNSHKGQGGGFKLNVAPSRIYLLDIMEVFQGPLVLSEHVFKSKVCPHIKKCKLKKKLDGIKHHAQQELKDITLESLLQG